MRNVSLSVIGVPVVSYSISTTVPNRRPPFLLFWDANMADLTSCKNGLYFFVVFVCFKGTVWLKALFSFISALFLKYLA